MSDPIPMASERLPFVGHLHHFAGDPIPFLMRCRARHGPTVRLDLGRETVLVTQAEDVRHALIANADNYAKSVRIAGPRARRVLGEGLLNTSSCPAHLELRRTLQPLFQRAFLAGLEGHISESIDAALERWADGTSVDVVAEGETLALGIVVDLLFGARRQDRDALCNAIQVRRRRYEQLVSSLFPRPTLLPPARPLAHRAAMRRLEDAIANALATHDGDRAAGPLIQRLGELRHSDGSPLTPSELRSEVITFLDAGYKTVGAALGWTLLLLAQHPEAQRMAQQEVEAACGSRGPQHGHLPDLPGLRAVVQEALRLYPPTWFFVREAKAPDRLPSGATVAPGTKLYLCSYLAHRDPAVFEHAERFHPERFLGGETPSQMTYFPFGRGAHKCIGQPLFELEAQLVLARVLQSWSLGPPSTGEIQRRTRMVLRPRGPVQVPVHRRPSASNRP